MFHSLQSNEQYEVEDQYQISFTMSPWPPVDNIHHNLIVEASNIFPLVAGAGGGEGLKKLGESPVSENQENKNDETKLQKKSKSQCEIERQRRKEMANLYASLRKLLPFEYIKGKRSTSDHMHEAVNYINNMQKNISRLRLKNEMLTKNPKYSCTRGGGVSGNANAGSCLSRQLRSSTVTANLCQNGVEILISKFTPKEEVFPISRILKKLLVLDLDVISYMSTSSNDGCTLYKIISEVADPSCINIIGLQKTLTDTITQYTT